MKKAIMTLAAVLVATAAFAQGQVNFLTRLGTAPNFTVNAPVTYSGAGNIAGGPPAGAFAMLYLVGAGGSLTPIAASKTTFRTTTAGREMYINPLDVTVPGVAVGSPATLRMVAFVGADYETALTRGESANVTVNTGGDNGVDPASPASNLVGLQGFAMTTVPEPSTIALAGLGVAALLFRRRK